MERRPERGLRRDEPGARERAQRRRLFGGSPDGWTEREPQHPGREWEHERTGGPWRGEDPAWERSPREPEPPRPGYGSAWESQRGYDRSNDFPRSGRGAPYDDEPWRSDGPGAFGERSYAGYGDRSSARDVENDRGVSHPDHERMHSRRRPVGMDAGRYTGLGPRGYQRSDERIREQVCDLLLDAAHVDASGFDVQVSDGEVTLEGTVPDRRMKRDAEDLVERVAGVAQVHNRLRVQISPITGAVDSDGHTVR